MHLPGRLSTSTLGDLLGALHRERTTGLLELREVRGPFGRTVPGRVHRIHLRAGLVVAIDTTLTAATAPLRERIEALFSIDEASIAFYTARPLTHVVRVAPLGPGEFLHGRPRARDRKRAGAREPAAGPPRSGTRALLDDARERARKLLGIPTDAETGDVRRAFRRKASALHPDRLVAAPVDEQRRQAARFAELSAAYHLLVA